MSPPAGSTRLVAATVATWLVVAVGLGASGMVQNLRPPGPQLVLAGLTVCGLLVLRYARAYRAWITAVDPRILVAFHLTRFVGIYFLVLHERGELPYDFAVLGGWGDIAVATLAAGLLALGPPSGRWRVAYVAWNVIGLADILFVVATATRLAVADPESLAPLLDLPLSLLPTFVVPIILMTHFWLFVRLTRFTRTAPIPNG